MRPTRKRGMGRCFQQLCCFITHTNQRTDDPEDFEEFCVNAHASHFLMDNAVLEMDEDEDELFSQPSGNISINGLLKDDLYSVCIILLNVNDLIFIKIVKIATFKL